MYMPLFFSDFCRSFIVNEFLLASFVFLCDSTGNRIGWGIWVKKNQEETLRHSILKGAFLLAQQRLSWPQRQKRQQHRRAQGSVQRQMLEWFKTSI
jgi:hypothetical protein